MAFPSHGTHTHDSAFARQIDAGYPWLRFDAELEPGFRELFRDRLPPHRDLTCRQTQMEKGAANRQGCYKSTAPESIG
mgnify:CR=1 FL=1